MLVSELLSTMTKLAKDNGLSEPFIVGGIPRDKAFDRQTEIKDLDITTGDEDSLSLGLAVARVWPDANFKVFNDGHASMHFQNLQVDFSNNFIIPGIEKELKKLGIDNPSNLHKEMYSRDFTINTMLQPMDLSKDVIDITGKGLLDAKNKVLRTPISALLTIGHDPRRILRALKLAMKFDLTIAPSLKSAIVKYRGGLKEVPMNSVKKQVNEMLEIDPRKAIELLSEFKLLPILPLSRLMMREMAKNNMIQHLLEE